MEKKVGQTGINYSSSKYQQHNQNKNNSQKEFQESSLHLSPGRMPLVTFGSNEVYIEEELTGNAKNIYIDPAESEHQRHSITIIKDTAHSYQFISETKPIDLILPEEEHSSHSAQSLYNEFIESIMTSTIDKKSFEKKPIHPEGYSTILTLSPSVSEPLQSEITEHVDFRQKEELSNKHALLTPVFAFCSTCETNIRTVVIENMYPGSL